MKNAVKMILIVLGVIAAVFGFVVWLNKVSPEPVDFNPAITGEQILVRDNSHMTGNRSAGVILVEFGDYQCPFCAASNPAVKQVVDKYRSNPEFNFVYRHLPLPQHKQALPAAMAAEAAGAQGKFWEMHNLLYEKQNDWAGAVNANSKFVSYASELGLNVERFQSDLNNQAMIDAVTQDLRDAEEMGLNSTPTFILNGERAEYSELDQSISSLLSR